MAEKNKKQKHFLWFSWRQLFSKTLECNWDIFIHFLSINYWLFEFFIVRLKVKEKFGSQKNMFASKVLKCLKIKCIYFFLKKAETHKFSAAFLFFRNYFHAVKPSTDSELFKLRSCIFHNLGNWTPVQNYSK